MTRAIYRSLLHLHPPAFRRQFAGEMLWIFDQASASEGAFVLFLDLLISLARQWLIRSAAWKVPLALIGASLQVMAGGLGFVFRPFTSVHRVNQNASADPVSVTGLMEITLIALGIVFAMLFALVFWVNGLNRKRRNRLPRHNRSTACGLVGQAFSLPPGLFQHPANRKTQKWQIKA
jgi:hypothetical protein